MWYALRVAQLLLARDHFQSRSCDLLSILLLLLLRHLTPSNTLCSCVHLSVSSNINTSNWAISIRQALRILYIQTFRCKFVSPFYKMIFFFFLEIIFKCCYFYLKRPFVYNILPIGIAKTIFHLSREILCSWNKYVNQGNFSKHLLSTNGRHDSTLTSRDSCPMIFALFTFSYFLPTYISQ